MRHKAEAVSPRLFPDWNCSWIISREELYMQFSRSSMASRNLYRMFVGNLPWTVSHRELRQHFSQFGYISNAHVVFDKSTGLSRGFGFIQFGNRNSFDAAINKATHILEGNILDVQPTSK